MSTAGKVLVVLNMLAVIGWLVLAAGITALNEDYGKKIQKLEQDIAAQQKEVDELLVQVEETQRATIQEQKLRNNEYAALRSRLSNLDRIDSENKETKLRYDLQKESVDKQVAGAQFQLETRTRELTEITKQKDDAEIERDKIKDDVNKLFAELKALRDDFSGTMTKNKEMLQSLTKTGSRATMRRAVLGR